MDEWKNLEKPVSELCIISENEKTFQGAIKWHIPELEIREYLQNYTKGNIIESNTFSIGTPSYCSFYLRVHPDEGKYTNQVCVSIVFYKKLPDSAWIKGEVRFDGVDKGQTFSISANDFDGKIEINKLCRNSDLHRLLYNTCSAVIYCSMKIREREIKCSFDKQNSCYAKSRNFDYSKDSVKHESFSDVSVNIDGHPFKTHKIVLAQIPYFQNLFDANKLEQCFVLTNIETDIFRHILTFLYSGDIPQLNFKLACKLYIVANDLKIFNLQCLCSSYLGANLTEMNVVIVLKLSHEYEDITLKKECFKFIKKCDVETLAEKSVAI